MMTKERDKEIKPDRKGGVIWPYVRGKKTRGIVRASPSNSAHTTRDLDKKPRAAYMCSQATNNFRKKTTTKNAGHESGRGGRAKTDGIGGKRKSSGGIYKSRFEKAHQNLGLNVGECVICEDRGMEYPAEVKAVDSSLRVHNVFVHFHGWSARHDVWLPAHFSRVCPSPSFPQFGCNQLFVYMHFFSTTFGLRSTNALFLHTV